MTNETKELTAPETTPKMLTTKDLLNREDVQKRFKEMLGQKAQGFITSVLQIVASDDQLKNADPMSVYNAAAVAATLDLPLNNNLGFAYIIAYKQNYNDPNTGQPLVKSVAQFQMGYKGFKQLAIRTGEFDTIHATDVREGELKHRNRLTGEMKFEWIQDEAVRNKKAVIGYVSYFRLLGGFSQTFYMTVEELKEHGAKYSKTFEKKTGRWTVDFDGMCMKTVTKLNLSKNAPLSIEMRRAIVSDQAVINNHETEDVTYVDNSDEPMKELTQVDVEQNRRIAMVKSCTTLADLDLLATNNPEFDADLIAERRKELTPAKSIAEIERAQTLKAKEMVYDQLSDKDKASDKGQTLLFEISELKGEVK